MRIFPFLQGAGNTGPNREAAGHRDCYTLVRWSVKDRSAVRERYLRDALPTRLGGLAANLSRIRSFAAHDASRDAVESLIDESKYFIEWTAADAETQTAAELVDLQIQLSQWQYNWVQIWTDPAQRRQIAEASNIWSKRALELSGLLKS